MRELLKRLKILTTNADLAVAVGIASHFNRHDCPHLSIFAGSAYRLYVGPDSDDFACFRLYYKTPGFFHLPLTVAYHHSF